MGATDGAVGSAGDVIVTNEDGTVLTTGDYSIGVVSTCWRRRWSGWSRKAASHLVLTVREVMAVLSLSTTKMAIRTSGDFAPAYLIQSVGGGGGQVGLGDSEGWGSYSGGGSNGTAGNGGQLVLVNAGGVIQATGEFLPGVIHQSIGGGMDWKCLMEMFRLGV